MKKLITLVVVVLMVVGAKAQTEIVVGPKVGLNMTNISNSDKKNKLSFRVGSLNSGLTIILLSSPNWCIQDREPGIKSMVIKLNCGLIT